VCQKTAINLEAPLMKVNVNLKSAWRLNSFEQPSFVVAAHIVAKVYRMCAIRAELVPRPATLMV
jgi:hypothetical protein